MCHGLYVDVPKATRALAWHALVCQHVLRILESTQRLLGLWSNRAVQRPRGAPHGLEACRHFADTITAWETWTLTYHCQREGG